MFRMALVLPKYRYLVLAILIIVWTLMGTDEQRGIDAAVTYLGEAGWSNGKVGFNWKIL